MTPEAQNIAIATAYGMDVSVCPIHRSRICCGRNYIPDYFNSLDAMHVAEKHAKDNLMNSDQWEEYGRLLERAHPSACITLINGKIDYYDFATLMCELTAAQRAEALLRVLGLWI